MNDNDKNLKDMWNKAENLMGGSEYESDTIGRFISGKSRSVSDRIRKMLQMDIALKMLFAFIFIIDAILYYNVQFHISLVCMAGIIVAIPLALFELSVLKKVNQISDYGQSAKEKLSKMLTFLRNDFFTSILSITSTGLLLFISGLLMYFFVTYGELRRLGNMDVFVFSSFALLGLVMNYVVNTGQVRYHIKHIEACLSDLNDNLLAVVTSNIEIQQKQDKTTKMLFYFILIFGFIVLVVILKKLGF